MYSGKYYMKPNCLNVYIGASLCCFYVITCLSLLVLYCPLKLLWLCASCIIDIMDLIEYKTLPDKLWRLDRWQCGDFVSSI